MRCEMGIGIDGRVGVTRREGSLLLGEGLLSSSL